MPDVLPVGLCDGMHRLRLDDGRAVIAKIRRDADPDFFAAEARGLDALRATHTLRVPHVVAVHATSIVLEDLGNGSAFRADWERAGAQLAQMHRIATPAFGFATQGWCGDSTQDNTPDADGHTFFAQRRLQPQAHRAHARGLLDRTDLRAIERIGLRLRDWIPAQPPVLVHGDLWLGNLHACANGELALIDSGAVHQGWAEADLAMLTLFGAPPRAFFACYEDAANIDRDWRERAPLYNLYHRLNHLNLFGTGYLAGVREVLRGYD